MNMSSFNKIRVLGAFVTCSALYSAAMAAGPGWVQNVTVKKLITVGDGGIDVEVSPPLSGCTSNGGYGPTPASIYPSNPGLNRMLAQLLLAQTTGTPVSLYLVDNTCRVGEMVYGQW